ncbi:hypothetical protein WB401_06195 [Streptomyces brasiliscabiei]|uniref:Regulatory protein n=1 Tax=Streptomyces brasiliscabiei TaxID=2736302 RepID=A0ABU8G956_9ACTN
MTETPSETTDLKAQYTAQVSADLERNAKEQERLRQEIDALQEQLQSLQQDRSVLANMQQALGVMAPGPAAGSAAEPVSVTEEVAAPSVPRQKTGTATTTAPTTGKRTRAKRAPAPQTGKQAKKPATAKPKAQAKTQAKTATAEAAPAKTATAKSSTATTTAAKPAPAKKTQPTLVELIRRHLTEQSEPRSAAEVATALTQAHPDRRIQTNVVRTTLEGLVAKSNAQRTRQGSSVYYTAPDTQEPAQDQPQEQPQAPSEAAESE